MLKNLRSLRREIKFLLAMATPGAGKGTAAGNLQAILDPGKIHILSMSAVLTQRALVYDPLGRALAHEHEKRELGGLASDKLTMLTLEERVLKLHGEENARWIFLDGAVRTLPQAKALIKTRVDFSTLHLITSDSDAIRRIQKRAIKEGRPDDAHLDTIANRIATFHSSTGPAIKHLKNHDRRNFYPIHTNKGEHHVVMEILKAMGYRGSALEKLDRKLQVHLEQKEREKLAAQKTSQYRVLHEESSQVVMA